MSFFNAIGGFFITLALIIGGIFGGHTAPNNSLVAEQSASSTATIVPVTAASPSTYDSGQSSASTSAGDSTLAPGQTVYTEAELLAMAGNPYASGSVPLGDYHYVTDAPKVGYVYLCNVHKDNPGSSVIGPWVHGDTWNFLQKVSVQGSVSWPNATFSNIVSGAYRVLTGNDLPVGYTTGVFPVASSDPAHAYDPNPNTISAQALKDSLPANPVYSNTPYCMGGEVGVMTDGVALFDAFDAGLRDAPAHELQDSCNGHPQGTGEYHYHSLPACFTDIMETTVLGYAYDGFPITGPEVAPGKFLTTANLDVCHGLTSTITEDGKQVTTYHYVMTQDFPYSASCFRGKPTTLAPSSSTPAQSGSSQSSSPQSSDTQAGAGGSPPQSAIDACSGKGVDSACSMTTPQGTLTGTCRTPPNSSLACIPDTD